MRVLPAPGLVVRDPRSKRLIGPEGLDVDPLDFVYLTMLRDGDLVREPEPDAAAAPPAPEAPADLEHQGSDD